MDPPETETCWKTRPVGVAIETRVVQLTRDTCFTVHSSNYREEDDDDEEAADGQRSFYKCTPGNNNNR